MPVIINDQKDLILYLHIPKCAGSSFEKSIISKYQMSFLSEHRIFGKVTPQHLDLSELEKWGLEKICKYHFAIVRDPLNRIVSEYKYRRGNDKWCKRLLDFDSFVDFCFSSYKKNKNILDNHIKPQVCYLSDKVDVYKLEDGLDAIIDEIKHKYLLKNVENSERVNVSVEYNLTISTKTLNRVYGFYEDDYIELGYKKQHKFDLKEKGLLEIITSKLKLATYKLIFKFRHLVEKNEHNDTGSWFRRWGS